MAQHTNCRLEERKFEERDLENKDIVVLATDDKALHQQIKLLARKKTMHYIYTKLSRFFNFVFSQLKIK